MSDERTRRWRWPLERRVHPIPESPSQGAFGAIRRHDVHTGVDLYGDVDDEVLAVEDGVVVAVEDFTGARAGSPWWLDTQAVLVEGPSGVVLYGELEPAVRVGDVVREGDLIGRLRTVLRHDKGLPMTMLHLELYAPRTRASMWWHHGEARPDNLLDPTPSLREAWREATRASIDAPSSSVAGAVEPKT